MQGTFFEVLHDLGVLPGMPGAGADVREADRLEDLADGSFVICDAEAVRDDLPQVQAPPPDDAVDPAIRDGLGELGQLRLRQPGQRTPRLWAASRDVGKVPSLSVL